VTDQTLNQNFEVRTTYLSVATSLVVCILMLVIPIYKGGNTEQSIAILFGVMGLVFLIEQIWGAKPISWAWLLVWGVVTLAVLAHCFVVPAISDFELGPEFIAEHQGHIRENSVFRILSVWAYFGSMLLVAWKVSNMTKPVLNAVYVVLIVVIMFQAVFGLAHLVSKTDSVLGLWDKVYGLKDATGTFVNRNHFAGFLGLCWPVLIAVILSTSSVGRMKISFPMRALIVALCSALIAIAVVTSHSRMGLLSAVCGLLMWGAIFSREYFKDSRKVVSRWMPIFIGMISLLAAVWFGVDDLIERFIRLDNNSSRIEIWRSIMDLPVKTWIWGVGPGAFEDVFHLYQPTYLNVRFVHAHNDYLEVAYEFGLFFTLLIVLAIFFAVRFLLPKGESPLRAGIIGGFTVAAVHSLADFSLQIPAYAFYFSVFIGLLLNPETIDNAKGDQKISTAGADHTKPLRKKKRSQSRNKSFLKSLVDPD